MHYDYYPNAVWVHPSDSNTVVVGGTSLLIVVSVVIETYKKIESQLTMRDYESL